MTLKTSWINFELCERTCFCSDFWTYFELFYLVVCEKNRDLITKKRVLKLQKKINFSYQSNLI